MRIKNTSKIPTEQLKPLFEFAAKGCGHAGVEVHVRNEPHYPHGRCYWGIPDMANVAKNAKCLITLHLPPLDKPQCWPDRWGNSYRLKWLAKKWPHFPFETWQDCVIYLTAHEFRHFWQWNRIRRWRKEFAIARAIWLRSPSGTRRWEDVRPKRPTGKREHDASAHGLRMLNKWREHTGRSPIEPVKQPNPFIEHMGRRSAASG